MRRIALTAIFLICTLISSVAQIGTWRAYMAYNDITDVQKGGSNIYVLASKNLYYYNTNDHSIHTFDKMNGLNDCNIDYMAWCQTVKKLIVIYENGNIDLIKENDEVENIADYKNKSITANKTINDVYINDKYAYISTGFGILKINLKEVEISETYNLEFSVDYTYIAGSNIYAASKQRGIYCASLSNNLLNPNSWVYSSSYTQKDKSIDQELLAIVNTLNPGGPKYNYFGYTKFINNSLYSCNGETYLKEGYIQVLKDIDWTIYQDDNIKNTTGLTFSDIKCVDVDPRDANHIFAGARNGLYEFNNGKFVNYYGNHNSPIEAFNNKDKEYQLITGLTFDKDGNLWILNSQAPTQAIIEYTKNGEWISHYTPELMKLNDGGFNNKSLPNMVGTMIDSRGLIWFVNNHFLITSFYNYDPTTKKVTSFVNLVNQDGKNILLTQGIRCIAEDKSGNIWIGTDTGPFMLKSNDIRTNNAELIQVKVPRNDGTNFADYLLAGLDITTIAVDEAGRKWFGTNNDGAYLISEDNYTQIEHFTVNNSKLISNNVMSIDIDHATGEVFFGTNKGLCSYISDATQPNEDMNKDNVYAYPNPVTPDYTGSVTITGLSYNSDVKIVTVNGTLVASGTSNGGTFQWNCNDTNGRRVASGIYNVVTAKRDGSQGTVCKIAIIN